MACRVVACALLMTIFLWNVVAASHLSLSQDLVVRVAALVEADDATTHGLLDGYKFWEEQVNGDGGFVIGRTRYRVEVIVFLLDGSDAQAYEVSSKKRTESYM